MSLQIVTEWRTRALYNKFLDKLEDRPGWLRKLLRENPGLYSLLVDAIEGDDGKFVDFRQRVQALIRDAAYQIATQEVAEGQFDIARMQDTIENQ